VRGPKGSLISWAAAKLKSADVWEMAVTTEADYRGRGYARDVVSAATRHTLEAGRLAIYIHDHDNRSSAYVARSLGYKLYSEIVLAEF
jgi:predicted GNAT family acetyltransferase